MPYVRRLPSGKWQGTYRAPSGQRRGRTFGTKAAARLWATDRESEIRRGQYIDPHAGRITLREWHDRWWAARVVERNTADTNRSHLTRHVLPAFGDWPIDSLTRLEIQGWVRQMQKNGVGPATITKCRHVLSSLLKAAVDEELIRGNPAQGVTVPTLPVRGMRALDPEEIEHLLAVHVEPWRTLWELAAFSGLRWGELAGLQVNRLDLLRRRLHVVEVAVKGGVIKRYPKNTSSQRTVPLPSRVVTSLARHLEGHTGGLVFGPLEYSNVRARVWLPGLERAGLADPQPTIHSLRHSSASNLVAAGAGLREVMEIHGWTQMSTMQKYVHTTEDRKAAAVLRAYQ